MYQILKFPVLIEHFIEHRSENPDLSLYEFLALHYSSETNYDADYDEDMKLPFKTHNESQTISITAVYFSDSHTKIISPVLMDHSSPVVKNDMFIYSSYSSSIFQPPKKG